MELQDSEDEDEIMVEDLEIQDKITKKFHKLEENPGRKKQKREKQWSPVQRMDRPRRHSKDGKTMMQRAQELKDYKNLGRGTKPSLIITSESNDSLIAKAKCVNISLGSDDNMIANNIDLIRDKEKRFLREKS